MSDISDRPWRLSDNKRYIVDALGQIVDISLVDALSVSDRSHAIKCVNEYESLIDRLEKAEMEIVRLREYEYMYNSLNK